MGVPAFFASLLFGAFELLLLMRTVRASLCAPAGPSAPAPERHLPVSAVSEGLLANHHLSLDRNWKRRSTEERSI